MSYPNALNQDVDAANDIAMDIAGADLVVPAQITPAAKDAAAIEYKGSG